MNKLIAIAIAACCLSANAVIVDRWETATFFKQLPRYVTDEEAEQIVKNANPQFNFSYTSTQRGVWKVVEYYPSQWNTWWTGTSFCCDMYVSTNKVETTETNNKYLAFKYVLASKANSASKMWVWRYCEAWYSYKPADYITFIWYVAYRRIGYKPSGMAVFVEGN